MKGITILPREIASEEYALMKTGFDENTAEHYIVIQISERVGFVAMDQDLFIGCSSGLAYKNGGNYNGWFYPTDFFMKKQFLSQGLGTKLLSSLEKHITQLDINNIWTWTAGYEAPEFYQKQGYAVFTEMKNWYSEGSSRIGLKKTL